MNSKDKNISQIYDRDNICIIAALKYTLHPKNCFLIANSHLLFNNNRGDIKLAQTYQILQTLKQLKQNFNNLGYEYVNLILCGDFNSVPNSGVYKLITEGSVDCTNLDRRKVKYFSYIYFF
jgi:mRNA deadenylase 3'-5' endonuclease subunit Ccr4